MSGIFSVLLAGVNAPKIDSEVFVLAGGAGGGGGDIGTGGGAGGAIYNSALPLTTGVTYSVVVGAGSPGGVNNAAALNGYDSTFSGSGITTMTAVGGGRGAGNSANGFAGGCGGGAPGYGTAPPYFGGASNQGSSGGTGFGFKGGDNLVDSNTIPLSPPGSGGLGAAGQDSSTTVTGAGGVGLTNWSAWCVALNAVGFAVGELSGGSYYLGGGGGSGTVYGTVPASAGGLGGGGRGGKGTTPIQTSLPGTDLCGGGGGGGNPSPGKPGGKGVVMIRYPDPTGTLTATSTTGSPTTTTSGGYRYYAWSGDGSITF